MNRFKSGPKPVILYCNKTGVAEVKTERPYSSGPERTLRLPIYEGWCNFAYYPLSKTQRNLAPGYSVNCPLHPRMKDLEDMDS